VNVDEGGVALDLSVANLELVGTEGEARGRKRSVQGAGMHRHGSPAAVHQIAEKLGDLGIVTAVPALRAEQHRIETAQHALHECRLLVHDADRVFQRLRDVLARAPGRLESPADCRDGRPVDERQVELVAHHSLLAQQAAVGLSQVAGETFLGRNGHVVFDGPMQPMLPDRELATGQVAQQAALGFVALGDRVLVGALEGHAVETPHPKVVPTPGDHIDGGDQRRERDEARQRVLRLCTRPMPGPCVAPSDGCTRAGDTRSRG